MKRWHEETTLMKSRWREELKTHGYSTLPKISPLDSGG